MNFKIYFSISSLLILMLTFCEVSTSFGQLKLIEGQKFLPNIPIKKVIVAARDNSVWALSNTGIVYYKLNTDSNFSIYTLTNGLIVSDLAGFNEQEMYFVVGPDVILQIKSNIKKEIKCPSKVNGISAVNGNVDSHYITQAPYQSIYFFDWIAIATDKDIYKILRGESDLIADFLHVNKLFYENSVFTVTNAGLQSQDIRFSFPTYRCPYFVEYNYYSFINSLQYQPAIPDNTPLSTFNNTSLFITHFMRASAYYYSSMINMYYYFWGATNGLFIRAFGDCTKEKQLLFNQKINDIEEFYALTNVFKQNYVVVASDSGIYFTPRSAFPISPTDAIGHRYENVSFKRINGFPVKKVNTLSASVEDLNIIAYGNNKRFHSVCQKVIWAGADDGLQMLIPVLDQKEFDNYSLDEYQTINARINTDFNNPIYEVCESKPLRIKQIFFGNKPEDVFIEWFRNNVKVPEFDNQAEVFIYDEGVYYSKVTSLCEGIYLKGKPFTVVVSAPPVITFNYPPEIKLCEGQKTILGTVYNSNYKFRWVKDGVIIPQANLPDYQVSESGIYKVEVSSCEGSFKSSQIVKVEIQNIPQPLISSSKTNLCLGESAIIKVDNPNNYNTTWYLNGIPINQFSNKNEILVNNGDGFYEVKFGNNSSCDKTSNRVNLKFESYPSFEVISTNGNSLCYGESTTLNAGGTGSKYLWSTGQTTPSINVSTTGEYTVTVFNELGCGTTKSLAIDVKLPINLSEPEVSKICTIASEKLSLKANEGYAFYTWNGDRTINSTYEVTKTGTYVLEVEDTFGCKVKVNYTVIPFCKEVIIPNTFSPNNDGINDLWKIGGIEEDNGINLKLFNRYGNLIIEFNGCCISWDGFINGSQVPVGTYYYLLTTKSSKDILNGSVSVIR